MVKLTKPQRKALFALFKRERIAWQSPTLTLYEKVSRRHYINFRKTVQPYMDGSGCVIVPWCGMWVGIEVDGYTHS